MRAVLTLVALAAPLAGQTIVNQFNDPSAIFLGGLEYDAGSDSIWAADETAVTIRQYDRAGTPLQSFAVPYAAGTLPIGVGVDPASGNLWVGDENEIVYEVTPLGVATGTQWSTTPAIIDVSGVAVDPLSGNIFISQDSTPRQIVEFDQAGNVVMTIALGSYSVDPDGLGYNANTDTFFLGEDTGDQIIEVDRLGNMLQSWPTGSLGISPEGVGVDATTGRLFVSDGFTATVYELDGIVSPSGLSGSPDQISLSLGGSQVLSMDVADAYAGSTYFVLGSASGSAPGFPYTGVAIPLNPDAYTIFTLLNPNTPLLNGSAGSLNSLGQATAVFTLPPASDPSLAGLVVNHAGVVLSLISAVEATNAASVTLVP